MKRLLLTSPLLLFTLAASPRHVLAIPTPTPQSPASTPLQGFGSAHSSPKNGLLPIRWVPNSRVAQANTAQQGSGKQGSGKQGPEKASKGLAPKATRSSSPSLVPVGGTCITDEQCVAGSWCDDGSKQCKKLQVKINILYLFYLSGDRRFTEVLGLFWNKTGDTGYRVFFPFYWHFFNTTEKRRARVVFPFYWNFEDRRAKTRRVIVPPFEYHRAPGEKNYRLWPLFFWSDYGDNGAGLTVLPLFHRSRRGTHTSTIVPFLLSGYARDPKTHYSRGLVAGLYYWLRRGKEGTNAYERADALFPFFYHSSGPSLNATWRSFTWVLPLNFYTRRGDHKRLLVLPLLYHQTSPKSARTISLLPPFYYRRAGANTRLFSPLFLYEKDRDAKVTHWGLLAPPFYHRRDDEHEIDSLFPIFWRWHNTIEQTTTWVAGPLVTRSDPEGSSQILFPLFWRFADKTSGASTSLLFPLFYRHRRADGSHFNLIFPFYLGLGKARWSAGLFPLLFIGHQKGLGHQKAFGHQKAKGHAVLFPIFWHLRNEAASTTVLANLYYRREKKGWMAGIVPLFFAGRRGGDSHQILFPLFWHLRSKSEGYNTWVGGPFFHHRSQAHGRITGIFPLFVDAAWKGQHYTVAPLFYHRHDAATHKSVWHESVWVAGPYWRYHRGREFGDHLLPIAFYRRSFDTRGKRKTIRAGLLPLFYYRRTPKRTTLITPLGGYRRDVTRGMKQGLIGPVLWHESKKSKAFAVMPLFLRYTDKKAKATTSLLFPLLVHHTSPSIQALVIFPFYWRVNYSGDVHHPEEKNLVIFPLFWQTRQKKNGYGADVFFPFYWHLFDKKGSTWVLGPVFSHHRGARRNWGALPLAFYHKTKRKSWLFALPFFWYSHDFEKKQRTYVAGPAYYRRYEKKNKAEKKDKAGAGYLAGVAPLFFHKRTPEQHYTIFFPLVWHFAKPKKKTSLWIAGPYFSHASATKRGVGVFPLFYTSVKKTGERAVGVFPLFYWAKSPTRNALYTPLFGYDKTPERRHLYAGPYFQTRGSKVDRDIVFPLIYRSRNHETKTTTLFALPIYYGSWGPGKSVHVAFPLFWRWRGIDTTSTIVFPLYWDFNDHYASRTTVLFPLLARHRDSHAHSVSWYTLPGVWVRSRPEATDAVVFPLVWHFGGTKRSSTVVFPLYWRFDRPDARTYVVANTYYRRDKRNDTYDFWFLPLFRVQRPRPGDFNFEFLFGLVGYQRVGRNRILRLLYFPIELDPAPGQPSSGVAPLPARKTPVVQGARPQSPQQATPPI